MEEATSLQGGEHGEEMGCEEGKGDGAGEMGVGLREEMGLYVALNGVDRLLFTWPRFFCSGSGLLAPALTPP